MNYVLNCQHYSELANLFYPHASVNYLYNMIIGLFPKTIQKKYEQISHEQLSRYFSVVDGKITVKDLPDYHFHKNQLFNDVFMRVNFPRITPVAHYFLEKFNIDVWQAIDSNIVEHKHTFPTATILFKMVREKDIALSHAEKIMQVVEQLLEKDSLKNNSVANSLRYSILHFIDKNCETQEKRKEFFAHYPNDWLCKTINKLIVPNFVRNKAFYELEDKLSETLQSLDFSNVHTNHYLANLMQGNSAITSTTAQSYIWKVDIYKYNYIHQMKNSVINSNIAKAFRYIESHFSNRVIHMTTTADSPIVNKKNVHQIVIMYTNEDIVKKIEGFLNYVCEQTAAGLVIEEDNDDIHKVFLNYKLQNEMQHKHHVNKSKI